MKTADPAVNDRRTTGPLLARPGYPLTDHWRRMSPVTYAKNLTQAQNISRLPPVHMEPSARLPANSLARPVPSRLPKCRFPADQEVGPSACQSGSVDNS